MLKKKLINRRNLMAGFTLIEILVASFIFASVLAVVYGLLNDALISKKELELTLTINEQVKNANGVLQSVMQQASGDFFTDGEFGKTDDQVDTSGQTAHLFFVSDSYVKPSIVATPAISKTEGQYLYVKISNDDQKKIYIFGLHNDSAKPQQEAGLFLESWQLKDGKWQPDQRETRLLQYDKSLTAQFNVAKSGNLPKSIYKPSQGKLVPMDLYVGLKVTAVSIWKNKTLEREMNQIYVPLITSNPYL